MLGRHWEGCWNASVIHRGALAALAVEENLPMQRKLHGNGFEASFLKAGLRLLTDPPTTLHSSLQLLLFENGSKHPTSTAKAYLESSQQICGHHEPPTAPQLPPQPEASALMQGRRPAAGACASTAAPRLALQLKLPALQPAAQSLRERLAGSQQPPSRGQTAQLADAATALVGTAVVAWQLGSVTGEQCPRSAS